MGSSVVNDRILRVCMAYSLSALPYLCSPFYCSIGREFDEGAGPRSASVCTRRVWEFEMLNIWGLKMKGTSANAGPHYQKLYARVTHIRGNRRSQPSRSAMKGPHPERTS